MKDWIIRKRLEVIEVCINFCINAAETDGGRIRACAGERNECGKK